MGACVGASGEEQGMGHAVVAPGVAEQVERLLAGEGHGCLRGVIVPGRILRP